MKSIYCHLFMLSLLLLCVPIACAQGTADVNIGFGSVHVKPNGSGIDNINSANAFGTCVPGLGDPFCQSTPGLNGFLLGFGGDGMFAKRFGAGAEVSFLPSKGDYGPLEFRQTFYDFNGIYMPVNEKHIALKLMGGIGGARTSFSFNESSCVGTAICSTSSTPIGSSNHFQLHAGAGVEILLTQHVFIRPQFDLRYIPNFTNQFGSNIVPGGMFWIGFRTGGR
jgi:opacity protein-like surface antigen